MLAGRLIRAARDVLDEYSKFGIVQRLNAASNLCDTKSAIQDPQDVGKLENFEGGQRPWH